MGYTFSKERRCVIFFKRKSQYSGKIRTLELPVTQEQWSLYEIWNKKTTCPEEYKIQNLMPHLTKSDREFILSGITEDEWSRMDTSQLHNIKQGEW